MGLRLALTPSSSVPFGSEFWDDDRTDALKVMSNNMDTLQANK